MAEMEDLNERMAGCMAKKEVLATELEEVDREYKELKKLKKEMEQEQKKAPGPGGRSIQFYERTPAQHKTKMGHLVSEVRGAAKASYGACDDIAMYALEARGFKQRIVGAYNKAHETALADFDEVLRALRIEWGQPEGAGAPADEAGAKE